MKKAVKLMIGLLIGLSQIGTAHEHRSHSSESNIKIDRIQVNKMRALKREFRFELNHNHFRDARYIKYDIIELLKKDIRFQKKKIRDLKSQIEDNSHPYYRKSQSKKRHHHRNNEYYDDDSNFDLQHAKKEIRVLRRQLDNKRDLLYDLEYSQYNNPKQLKRDIRAINEIIDNMKTDVDLYYNLNIDSQYYRKTR